MIFDLLYFINIILSILIGIFLWLKLKPNNFSLHTNSLAAYLIFNAICFSFFLLIKYEYITSVPYLYKLAAPITYLIAPAAYFHVYFIVKREPYFQIKNALHFLPFIIFLISYLPFYFMSLDEKYVYVLNVAKDISLTHKDNVGLIPEVINNLGRILHPILYIILQWFLLISKKGKEVLEKEKTLYGWLFNFVRIQTFFFLSLVITVASSYFFLEEYSGEFFTNFPLFLTVFFFFLLSFYLFWNQKVLQKLKSFNPINSLENSEHVVLSLKEIAEIVYTKKYFTDTNDLYGISQKIGIPKNYLTKIIQLEYTSFSAWINHIKINYSKELIKKGYLNEYSVDALSEECGFNSINTFYRAFKKETGKTPKSFQENT